MHQIPSRGESVTYLFFLSSESLGWEIGWLFTPLLVRAILYLYLPSRRIRLTSITEKKGNHEHSTSRQAHSILTPLLYPATAEVWISKHHSSLWVKAQPPHVLKWRAAAVTACGTADGSQGLGCPLLDAKKHSQRLATCWRNQWRQSSFQSEGWKSKRN